MYSTGEGSPIPERDTLVQGEGHVALNATHGAYGVRGVQGFRQAHIDSRDIEGQLDLRDREAREELLIASLSTGATRPHGAGTREIEETADIWRTCFERDLDRIKMSKAFRRLAHKCQVYIAPEDDHLRNRLTHAVEVAQFGVSVGRMLGLNTTLIEAIGLGHDCGHGPAGHACEDALSPYMPTKVFDHAVWGANVTLRELNLCEETLDGIRNHSWKLQAPSTPEGELVSWADRVAYVCHDFDDAVRAGIIQDKDLPSDVRKAVGSHHSEQASRFAMYLGEGSVKAGKVGMYEEGAHALEVFRKFNYERIYLRDEAQEQAARVIQLIRDVTDAYIDKPWMLPGLTTRGQHLAAGSSEAVTQAVTYVSGMTDRFLFRQAVELCGWTPETLPRGT